MMKHFIICTKDEVLHHVRLMMREVMLHDDDDDDDATQ
jgi:hypothetical protein